MPSALVLISFILVGLYIAIGVNHLVLQKFSTSSRQNLYVAIIAFSTALFLLNSALLHQITDLSKSIAYTKANVALYCLEMMFFFLFIYVFSKKAGKSIFYILVSILAVTFVINIIKPYGILFEEVTEVSNISNSIFGDYYYLTGKPNFIYNVLSIGFYVFAYVFLAKVLISTKRHENKRKANLLVALASLFIGASVFDVMVDLGVIKSFYASEYFIFPVLLLLSSETYLQLYAKRKTEASLKHYENKFLTLIDNVQLIAVAADNNGRITYSNPYFNSLTGYDANELYEVEFMPKFIPERYREAVHQVFDDLVKQRNEHSQFENPILTKSGEERFIAWSNVLDIDQENEVQGVVCIGADITQRRKNRQELEAALQEIKMVKQQLEDENTYLKESLLPSGRTSTKLIGESDAMKYVNRSIREVASSDSTVLIEGETGVGKGLVAEAIYEQSLRKNQPFIQVNCGALSRELIESELFGHEKGAFTGAINSRKGRFELADKGTLFLDEIGELPMELQPKLLRVLQTGQFERLGSEKTLQVNVRVLAATNRDLKQCVEDGSFREDLFYRLSVFPITVPPLRKRLEDIPDLTNFIIGELVRKEGRRSVRIPVAVIKKLQSYTWPGNIRELRNILERALITSSNGKLVLRDKLEPNRKSTTSKAASLEEIEREHIMRTLVSCQWKISGKNSASEVLKINEATLRSKMKKLGIVKRDRNSLTS